MSETYKSMKTDMHDALRAYTHLRQEATLDNL